MCRSILSGGRRCPRRGNYQPVSNASRKVKRAESTLEALTDLEDDDPRKVKQQQKLATAKQELNAARAAYGAELMNHDDLDETDRVPTPATSEVDEKSVETTAPATENTPTAGQVSAQESTSLWEDTVGDSGEAPTSEELSKFANANLSRFAPHDAVQVDAASVARLWEDTVGDSGEAPTSEELNSFANAVVSEYSSEEDVELGTSLSGDEWADSIVAEFSTDEDEDLFADDDDYEEDPRWNEGWGN